MANLDDILKMIKETSEKKANVDTNFGELAKLGKAQFQALISTKPQIKPQAGKKEPDNKGKTQDDKADRKNSSNNVIINRAQQNNSDSTIKNNSNGKEVFSYDFTNEELVRGFIFSEILGRPKSKRRDKSFRGRRAR
jgi:hypothetical protein